MIKRDSIETLIQLTFDIGMSIHQDVGPGLLESVYERVLADRLQQHGVKVDRQQQVHVEIYGKKYDDAFRYDLLLNDMLLIEIKSLEKLGPVHSKQVLTYIRLMNLPSWCKCFGNRNKFQLPSLYLSCWLCC